ncbi:MAG: hypothetical protein KAJ75_00315 [Alphaproteobacteria bacterium]|nr:hypothetical protein [Alphaproteobacteria bacterium]
MTTSKAYELPDKKKYPELYKSDGLMRSKLHDVIKDYAKVHMTMPDDVNMRHFLTFFEKGNIKPSKIKEKLPELCKGGRILEAEFVLALQGEKLKKEDILNGNDNSALLSSTREDALLKLGSVMQRAGDPITKQDMVKARSYNEKHLIDGKTLTVGIDGVKMLSVAAISGILDQVKNVAEMNGEKLTKQDLMATVSKDEVEKKKLLTPFKSNNIACLALRTGVFDVVEQILTEEGTTLSIKDVMNEQVYNSDIGKLFSSPVFKDSSKNIQEAWKKIPEELKRTKENHNGYKTAIEKARIDDAKNAAKDLNKANIAALKKAAGR